MGHGPVAIPTWAVSLPRPARSLLAFQMAGKAFGKSRNNTHSHESPFCFGTFRASGPPKDQLWSCLKQQDHREGAFLKRGLMRTRIKSIWINHERAKRPESSQNKSEDFKTLSPKSKFSQQKELGCLVVRKILSSFLGGQGSSVLLAGGEGRARDLGQERSTWKEPTLQTLGGPKSH